MFHISEDIRAVRSAELICDGLSVCLRHKTLAEVSVTEICAAAGVGRTTFYRLFDNPADVVAYEYDRALRQLLQRRSAGNTSLARLMLQLVTENRSLAELVVHSGRMDILTQTHRRYASSLLNCLPETELLTEQEWECLLAVLSSLLFGLLSVWSATGEQPQADEFYAAVQKTYRLMERFL